VEDEPSAAASDPELDALRRADRTLFPRSLRGLRAGFRWDDEVAASNSDGVAEGLGSPKSRFAELAKPEFVSRIHPTVATYLEFYRSSAEGRTVARAWAKKIGRYGGAIMAELAKAGLPRELVWQSMVESGHNPTIRSVAAAAGLWQFMPETARIYGLVVDRWVDERLDPLRSTEAATRFLADLLRRFGNWELALAAYNMGDAGLSRSIRKYNTNDFWTLSGYEGGIPWETSLYVPKILALTIVMQNREAFGLSDVMADPAVGFDSVLVGPGETLSTISRAAGVTEEEIAAINPHILAGRTPPSVTGANRSFRIYVPEGTSGMVQRQLGKGPRLEPDLATTVVRRGDDLAGIAAREGTTVDQLRSLNRIENGESMEPGTVLLVPRSIGGEAGEGWADEVVAVVPPQVVLPEGRRRIFYRVVPHDSLSDIARSFGVTRTDLLEQNALDPAARLQEQMVLQVFIEKNARPAGVRYLEASSVRVLVAGTAEFLDYYENLRGNRRLVVVARAGDTLASIGERYDLSVGSMERINRRSRRDPLVPGERIVVYQKLAPGVGKQPVATADASNGATTNTVPRPDLLPGAHP
jgi:membrane-bound lytic murein transglycosylase D